MAEIEASLECPVCLLIPREVPIPSCSNGHIICKSCRQKMSSCPTCRVSYMASCTQNNSMVNSLASSLIETILHKCKFSLYHCHIKLKLSEISQHEAKCPERTVKCPKESCQQIVQLRMFEEHATEKKCSFKIENKNRTFAYAMSRDYFKWEGLSKIENDEFNPSINRHFSFSHLKLFDKTFYCFLSYQANKRNFIACVFLAEDPEVAASYKARISIFNKDSSRKITYDGDVLPIEEVPAPSEDFRELCRKCWCVQYENFREFLWLKKVGVNNNNIWEVDLHMEVDVFEKKSS